MDAVVKYFHDGGIFMYPILICAVWGLTLLIERTIFYFQTAARLTDQSQIFTQTLYQEGPQKAVEALKSKGILQSVLVIGFQNKHLPPERIEEKMEGFLIKHLPVYSKYLNLLGTLAGLLPILGLLGTVTGMIAIFEVIALKGTGDAQAMADGISQALITTQAGLIGALPILLGHTLLSNRLKKISDTVRDSATALLDYIKDNHAR
jgi:biopolymer transport protein ExbB